MASHSAEAAEKGLAPFEAVSPDGVRLRGVTAGNPEGPSILFLHGICQSHLAWRAQLTDPALAARFRMAAVDLRGHGFSDKPLDAAAYAEDHRWAGDVAAVIAAAGLERPVLVGWSYAGRVITDYLRGHGQGGIAGINFVGAVTRNDPDISGPERRHLAAMLTEDLAAHIEATRAFVRGCTAREPSREEFERALAVNMMVPLAVRHALIKERSHNPGDLLPALTVPVLVTHGAADAIILPVLGERTAAAVPGARLSLYEGVGHSPFAEAPERFNQELAAFAAAAHGQ